jgi:hypothetical protein
MFPTFDMALLDMHVFCLHVHLPYCADPMSGKAPSASAADDDTEAPAVVSSEDAPPAEWPLAGYRSTFPRFQAYNKLYEFALIHGATGQDQAVRAAIMLRAALELLNTNASADLLDVCVDMFEKHESGSATDDLLAKVAAVVSTPQWVEQYEVDGCAVPAKVAVAFEKVCTF